MISFSSSNIFRTTLLFYFFTLSTLVCSIANASPKSENTAFWGALAIDRKGNSSGYGLYKKSRSAAVDAALQDCMLKDCRVVAVFADSCAAIAIDDLGLIQVETSPQPDTAAEKALTLCRENKGKNCQLWRKVRCANDATYD